MAAIMNPEYYPLLNFHDRGSLKNLLETCGFEVELSQNYFESYPDRKAVSYVGVVARKSGMFLDDSKITELRNAARLQSEQARQAYLHPFATTEDALNFHQFRIPFIADMAHI